MRVQALTSVLLAGVLGSCGGGGNDGGGGNNPVTVIAKATVSGDNQTGTVATALGSSFCVKVSEDGAAKSGVNVAWSTPSGGSMSAPSTATGADGTACSKLTLGNTSGGQTAVATAAGISGSPVTFNATANPDFATDLLKLGGDLQQGNINTVLIDPLSVRVIDQFGNGVPNVGIDWAVTSGVATVLPVTGNTNASGVSNTVVTLGGTAGAIVITGTSMGLNGSPHTFNLTSVVPPPPPTAITINVINNSFSPKVDTVAAGGTVTWTWGASAGPHTVTSTGTNSFVSDPAGQAFAPHSYGPITFNNPGTYFYYCQVHGGSGSPPTGMSGTIVVQ